MLRQWRKRKGLALADGAKFLGLKSSGALSDLERGLVLPSAETQGKIEGATAGEITAEHHWRAWRLAHPSQIVEFRTAGRAAAKEFRKPATTKRRK